MAIGTSEVDAVLKTWANEFVEDVPAIHKDGQYLIEYNTLIDHLSNLDYDTLVNIMLSVGDNFFE